MSQYTSRLLYLYYMAKVQHSKTEVKHYNFEAAYKINQTVFYQNKGSYLFTGTKLTVL